MEILQRYLHAIEFWLPNGQRQDIIAEISEDLHSQIEDKQAALGRQLNAAELEALLKQRGRPVVVANQYLPQHFLIGPVWFPTYVFVLKVVGLCYVLPWLVAFVVIHRIQNPAFNWGVTMLAAWATLWTVAFNAAGIVTLIFSLLQFGETRTHFLERWNPRQLPPVRDPYKISRYNSLAELAIGLAFALWWIAHVSTPVMFNGLAFRLTLAPIRVYFFWGYLAVALFNIVLAAINLYRPYWTGFRAACRLASNLAGAVLFCWLMKADIIANLYIANVDSARTLSIRNAIHLWANRCVPIVVIMAAVIVAIDLYRIVRVSGERIGLTTEPQN